MKLGFFDTFGLGESSKFFKVDVMILSSIDSLNLIGVSKTGSKANGTLTFVFGEGISFNSNYDRSLFLEIVPSGTRDLLLILKQVKGLSVILI